MGIQHIPYTPRPVYEQHLFERGTMDAASTEEAIDILERISARTWASTTATDPASALGKAILESAAYRLRTQLRDYLTRGK